MSQSNAGPARPLVRPLSPHLQIWRWHVTMLASILHRVSGVGLYLGAFVVTAWMACAASGPEAYGMFAHAGASLVGLAVWIGFSWAVFYHLVSGVRHLIWDTGAALTRKSASALAVLSIWASIIATAAFWAVMFASHHAAWSGKVLL